MSEFESAFEYEETPDQKKAIDDVFADMSSPTPMDRLVCGDVGYGKTEVAMRAAMRAVADGKQVAVLSPTTVLAFQHLQTFRRRFAPFPVTTEMVSRLRSAKENRDVLLRAREGKVDIVIGTHRLLSKDVEFKDLGLVVVDEEQRFGVAAKERLKQRRTSIDSLTLSATPIPRTLQMGLSGLRDMSVIETPPRDRLAIQTMVVKFSKDLIATAIRHELEREGQVYVVHNRVESIYSLASMIKELVPEARVVVGHGGMTESELEKSMLAFVEGRVDVLVATTIVENGLDVPRANTLIVHRADRFGLAQLYQLRGRVGRSDRPAFAYLMVPPGRVLSEVAQRRLAAIREFSDLGSGFRLAALDLEMRGAGNLLGGEQSGHILAVGLDLYLKLLGDAVREMQVGGDTGLPERTVLNLRIDLRLNPTYIAEARDRILIYKRAADAAREEDVRAIEADLRDRFGPPAPGRDRPDRVFEPARAGRRTRHHPARPGRIAARPLLRGRPPDRFREIGPPRGRLAGGEGRGPWKDPERPPAAGRSPGRDSFCSRTSSVGENRVIVSRPRSTLRKNILWGAALVLGASGLSCRAPLDPVVIRFRGIDVRRSAFLKELEPLAKTGTDTTDPATRASAFGRFLEERVVAIAAVKSGLKDADRESRRGRTVAGLRPCPGNHHGSRGRGLLRGPSGHRGGGRVGHHPRDSPRPPSRTPGMSFGFWAPTAMPSNFWPEPGLARPRPPAAVFWARFDAGSCLRRSKEPRSRSRPARSRES